MDMSDHRHSSLVDCKGILCFAVDWFAPRGKFIAHVRVLSVFSPPYYEHSKFITGFARFLDAVCIARGVVDIILSKFVYKSKLFLYCSLMFLCE